MAINKVIYNKRTLIDLTGDTVSAKNLIAGATAHAANGERVVGEFDPSIYLEKTGDVSKLTVEFSETETESFSGISTGWTISRLFASLYQWLNKLKKLTKVAFTGSYNDLTDKPSQIAVQNNLTSKSTTDALAAAQGKVLDNKVSDINQKLNSSNRKLTASEDLNNVQGFQNFQWADSTPKNTPKSGLKNCTGVAFGDTYKAQLVATSDGNLYFRVGTGDWHQVAFWKV